MECQCDECKLACDHCPGWFMPGEAEKAAEFMKMSLKEFFDTYLAVNWWCDDEEIFVLAPALRIGVPGCMYPADPRGSCVFFNDGLCDIHPVKPFECVDMMCDGFDHMPTHEKIAMEWKNHQSQIETLLGHKPKATSFFEYIFGGL